MAQPAGMSWQQYAASMGHPGAANPVSSGWQPTGSPSPPQGQHGYALRPAPNPNPAYYGPGWQRRRNRKANRRNTRKGNRKSRRNTMRRRR